MPGGEAVRYCPYCGRVLRVLEIAAHHSIWVFSGCRACGRSFAITFRPFDREDWRMGPYASEEFLGEGGEAEEVHFPP